MRRRRLGGGVLLLGAATLAVTAARGGAAGVELQASPAAQVDPTQCVLGLFCPTPTPTPTHTATPPPHTSTPTPRRTPTPSASSSSSSSSSRSSTSSAPPVSADPGQFAFPTHPPPTPSPGAPPAPPELSVESVLLAPAGGDTVPVGGSLLVEATCIARRDTDTYSVAHAKVTFAVSAPPESSASVSPTDADSGDTGVATVSVDAGDVPGDLVLSATSGSAAGQLTIHVVVSSPTPSPSASATPTPVAAAVPASTRTIDSGGTTGGRAVAVAFLVALGAAILATTVLRIGLLPRLARRRPRRRSRVAPESPVSSS